MRSSQKGRREKKQSLIAMIKAAGITRDSSWHGYEKAKALLLKNGWMENTEYDQAISQICKFLKL